MFNLFPIGVLVVILGVLSGLDPGEDAGPVLLGSDDGPGDVGPVLPGLDSPDDGPGEVSPREDCAGLLCGGVEEGPLPGAVVPAVVIWTVGTEKAAVTTAAVGLPALVRSVLA